jgi:hypothetical protein
MLYEALCHVVRASSDPAFDVCNHVCDHVSIPAFELGHPVFLAKEAFYSCLQQQADCNIIILVFDP